LCCAARLLHQHGRGAAVHDARGDVDVPAPQGLQVQPRRRAVHADVGNPAARRQQVLPPQRGCVNGTPRYVDDPT